MGLRTKSGYLGLSSAAALGVLAAASGCGQRGGGSGDDIGATRGAVLGDQNAAVPKDPVKSGMPYIAVGGGFKGSAVLLTNEWVLTDAHNVTDEKASGRPTRGELSVVLPNSHDHFTKPEDRRVAQTVSFSDNDIVYHPLWRSDGRASTDVALIRLPKPLVVNGNTLGYTRRLSTLDRSQIIASGGRACGWSTLTTDQLRCRLNANAPGTLAGADALMEPVNNLSSIDPLLLEFVPRDVSTGGDSGGPILDPNGDAEFPNTTEVLDLVEEGLSVIGTGTFRSFMNPVTNFSRSRPSSPQMRSRGSSMIHSGRSTRRTVLERTLADSARRET